METHQVLLLPRRSQILHRPQHQIELESATVVPTLAFTAETVDPNAVHTCVHAYVPLIRL